MKLKILLLIGAAVAGVAASYALADGGRGHDQSVHTGTNASCQRTHLHGTVAAPQTLTVTVSKAGKASPFAPGQVVTVSLGSSGQTVRVNVEGCATGSSLTAKQAELHVQSDGQHGGGEHQSTTETTGTTTTVATTP